MQVVHRTVHRCRVCGCAEVRTDEVVDRGLWLLAECPRCEHRSAESLASNRPARRIPEVVREVAPAA